MRRRVDTGQPHPAGPQAQSRPERLYNANGIAAAPPLPGSAPIKLPDVPGPLDAAKFLARRHPLLGAMLGAYGIATFGAMMVDRDLSDIAEEFGLNLDTKAGRSAAAALLRARPQDGDWQRSMGEAAAVLELIDPGVAERSRLDPDAARKWNEFMSRAMTAIEEGRLRSDGDGFSGDWLEGMSILSEEERRLLEGRPGFSHNTPRQEDLILDDPMQEIEVPNHTGGVPEEVVPPGDILSTPPQAMDWRDYISTKRRNEPGTATGAGQSVGPDWVKEGERRGNMPIPDSVGKKATRTQVCELRRFAQGVLERSVR